MSVRLIIAKYEASSYFVIPKGVFILDDYTNSTCRDMNTLGEHYIKWDTLYYVAEILDGKPVIKQIQGRQDEGERKRPEKTEYHEDTSDYI
jgi:hypothetical protein